MKIKYLLLLIIVTFITLASAWWWLKNLENNQESISKSKSELRMVAVGDSLVAGVGASTNNDFVTLLSQKIGVNIINEGVSGNTSTQVYNRIDSIVLTHNPDIVILLVGGNDALQKIPLESTFKNITAIIQKIQASESEVVLVGIQGNIFGSVYQKEFDKIAKEYDVVYIPDILDGLIGNRQYMSDAVHPNDEGYKIMTDKIYMEVKDQFPYGF